MTERQLIVKPIGLVTQPNQKGQYPPGALATASDVVMRNPGDVQQAYAKSTFVSTLGSTVYGITTTGQQLVRWRRSGSATWVPSWVSSAGTANNGSVPSTSYLELSQVGRLQAITFRDRHIVTTENGGPLVADYANPSSSTERTFRFAGLPQPKLAWQGGSSNGQAIKNNTVVCYAVIVRRVFADGYELTSPPSPFLRAHNQTGGTVDTNLDVKYSGGDFAAGDVVEIYRTQSVPYAGVSSDPGTTAYLVKTYTLTSGNISSGFVSLIDSAEASDVGGPLNGLGRELYTNPSRGGLDVAQNRPPLAACVSTWRGRAWYANCKFPGSVSMAFRGGVGLLAPSTPSRTTGVGRRAFTGTYTSASTTVTGISAADIVGLKAGQSITGTHVVPGVLIASVGATSIVLAAAATGSGAVSNNAFDRIEIDGTAVGPMSLPAELGADYRVVTTRTLVDVNSALLQFNQQYQVRRELYVPPATMTLRATNGANYDPPLPEIGATVLTVQPTQRKNYVQWSDDQLPESVPPTNELYVGSGEIYALVPTRDALWAFCSDGLFRISGTVFPINGVPDVRVDPVDPNCILSGPRAWCVLRDRIYAITNQGFVEVTDNGARELSTGIVGDLIPGQVWAEAQLPYLVADERLDEVWVMQASPLTSIVYSARFNCFTSTTQFASSTHGLYLTWSRGPAFTTSDGVVEHIPATEALGVTSSLVDYQPLYGDRPDVLKQWIDVTYMVVGVSGGTSGLQPRFNGSTVGIALLEQQLDAGADIRVTYGISRDTPAISTTMRTGFIFNDSTPTRFSGISLRYVPITEQESRR